MRVSTVFSFALPASCLLLLVSTNVVYLTAATKNDEPPPPPPIPTNTTTDTTIDTENEWRRRQTIRAKILRRKWKTTFAEIRALTLTSTPTTPRPPDRRLDEWKLLLDANNGNDEDGTASPRQRFGGFAASWEARLEQWGEDVQEYVRMVGGEEEVEGGEGEGEGEGGYLFSRYGQPYPAAGTTATDGEEASTVDTTADTSDSVSTPTPPPEPTFTPRTILPTDTTLPHTDLSDPTKKIWIVTTAAYPWMTGTAVNPLLRAAYLATTRLLYNPPAGTPPGGTVTLMLPWLERETDRDEIYGVGVVGSREGQEEVVREWLRVEAGMEVASVGLRIRWYTGRLEWQENSIYSMGDIIGSIPEEEVDICVLEEPEHLNWYRAPGEGWTKKFKHVVGIVHTNYFVYAQEQPGALIRAPAMRLLSSWMCRAHCHRIIKLSGTLGQFAPEKEIVENVHGVRQTFLSYGTSLARTLRLQQQNDPHPPPPHPIFGPDAPPTVYFIGKMLWSKGIGSLLELLRYAEESAGLRVRVDMYGGGPNLEEARGKAEGMGLEMPFWGPVDHAELAPSHKIFINPSLSEVLCTTVAEALAMGKFVVVPSHPSNDFFAQFPNCLTYANKEEFVGNLYYALTHSPEPLSEEYSYALTWEAACKRFEAAGGISVEESEALKEAIAAEEAALAVEIDLPPLIEDPHRRSQISTTLKKTRARYRNFRSALSLEIRQSDVLPKEIQTRLLKELDRRLDLDVDTLLGSPKLRLQLSPAELDKSLLDFYDDIAGGPRGDVLRWIGAGGSGTVSAQYLYLRNQEMRTRWREERGKWEDRGEKGWSSSSSGMSSVVPQFLEDVGAGRGPTATKWIKRVLKRNLQQGAAAPTAAAETSLVMEEDEDEDGNEGRALNHDDVSQLGVGRIGGDSERRPRTDGGNRASSELQFQLPEIGCKRTSTFTASKLYFRPKPISLGRSYIPRRHPFTVTPLI